MAVLRNLVVAWLLIVTLPACGQDTTSNLVIHWKMDETSGSTAYDSSGNGYNGTVYGTASWQSGYVDNALYLNGASYARISGLASWSNITLAAWANLSAADSGGAELFSVGDYVILRLDASGKCEAIIYNGSGWDSVSISQTFAGSGWHHFAIVFSDTSNYLRLYIDGALAASATNYNSISYSGLGSNSYVGRHGNGSSTLDFTGKVDDVRFYSRALSATDIAALGSASNSLMAHWKLDEASGTSLYDASGYGHHAAFNTGSPAWISGKRETALEFNGSEDADTNSVFNPPATGTLAFWFRFDAAPTAAQRLLGNGGDWEVRTDSTGVIYCDLGGSFTSGFVTAAAVAEAGVWHHLAAVYNSSADTYTLYLDGAQVASGTSTISDQAAAILSFGARTGSTERFAGALDDIRVYSSELSHAQVVELYGLVGHWKFDEATGTTIADESPNDNDASFNTGTPAWTTGTRGAALEFNGASDADTDSSFDPPATGTISFWYHFNNLPTGTERLFGAGGDWEVRSDATGVIYADIGGGTAQTASDVASDGRWHHFAFRYNHEDDNYDLFIDGQVVASGAMTIADQGAATLSFGTRTGSTERFDGAIDDFRVYGYELTDAQVAELYGLIGDWMLDESSGSIASDSSGVGNQGYYWNGATPGAVGPYTGDGANAVVLDGVDDHVGVYPVDAYENITEYITVAAWVYFDEAISDHTAQQIIVGRDDWSSKTGFILLTDQPYSNSMIFRVFNGTTYADAAWSNPDIQPGKWHHVIGIYDGAYVRLYVDGELKNSTELSSPLVPRSSGNLNLGYALDGRLHGVRLYNRAISVEEIAELYGSVGWWKLNETTGSTAADGSLSGQDATYVGGVVEGNSGPKNGTTAAAFDGIDGHVALPTFHETFGSGFSMALWAKPTNTGNWARFADFGNGADVDNLFLTRFGTSSDLRVGIHDGSLGKTSLTAAAAITQDDWHHYAVTVDATGLATLYVDGEFATAGTVGTPSEVVRTSNYIARSNWAADSYFQGQLYDVRLFNRPMTTAEIATAYSAGISNGVRIIRWAEIR